MTTVHLVRHGAVANPNGVVYADLQGFNLSPIGVRQASAAAAQLAGEPIDVVLTSPLARARQTANAIARPHGLTVEVDDDLVETGQYPGWTGRRWDELDDLYPGQVDRYLQDASTLDDVDESLDQVAARMLGVIESASSEGKTGIVVVSHQDPTQAARLSMTRRPLSLLRTDPPDHCAIITLERTSDAAGEARWTEIASWAPALD